MRVMGDGQSTGEENELNVSNTASALSNATKPKTIKQLVTKKKNASLSSIRIKECPCENFFVFVFSDKAYSISKFGQR